MTSFSLKKKKAERNLVGVSLGLEENGLTLFYQGVCLAPLKHRHFLSSDSEQKSLLKYDINMH